MKKRWKDSERNAKLIALEQQWILHSNTLIAHISRNYAGDKDLMNRAWLDARTHDIARFCS